jgi:hypothetical protein
MLARLPADREPESNNQITKPNAMKKISLALAAVLGLSILAPATAEAGGCRTRVTYDDCGYTCYWEYRFVGHDCHGCPIYKWVCTSRCAPRYTPPCDDGYRGDCDNGYRPRCDGGYRPRCDYGYRPRCGGYRY